MSAMADRDDMDVFDAMDSDEPLSELSALDRERLSALEREREARAGPLWAAIESGAMDLVRALLPISDPSWRDSEGQNALYKAARAGKAEAARAILSAPGADARSLAGQPGVRGAPGLLMLSAMSGSAEMVELALGLPGADPMERCEGVTPLLAAAAIHAADSVRLLAPLSDLSARDERGGDAMARAVWFDFREAAEADREPRAIAMERTVEALAPLMGASGRSVSKNRTPLMQAAMLSWGGAATRLARALLPYSDLLARDEDNKSAFELALSSDNYKAAALLSDPASRKRFGDFSRLTPLMHAVRCGKVELISALLPGSDPMQVNTVDHDHPKARWGESAVDLALYAKNGRALIAMLPGFDPFGMGSDRDCSVLANALFSFEPGVSCFLDEVLARCPIPRRDCSYEFAAALAAGRLDWVERLAPHADWVFVSPTGLSALSAAAYGAPEWVERLIERNDPMKKDRRGRSALMWGAINGQLASVMALMPVSLCEDHDEQGDTALHLAIREGKERCADALGARAGARVKNKEGRSVYLEAAAEGSARRVVELGLKADVFERDAKGQDVFDLLLKKAGDRINWASFQGACSDLSLIMGRLPLSAKGESVAERAMSAFSRSESEEEIEAFFLALEESIAIRACASLAAPGAKSFKARL